MSNKKGRWVTGWVVGLWQMVGGGKDSRNALMWDSQTQKMLSKFPGMIRLATRIVIVCKELATITTGRWRVVHCRWRWCSMSAD